MIDAIPASTSGAVEASGTPTYWVALICALVSVLPRSDELVNSPRSEEHTSELQSLTNLVCRLLLEKKKKNKRHTEQSPNITQKESIGDYIQ